MPLVACKPQTSPYRQRRPGFEARAFAKLASPSQGDVVASLAPDRLIGLAADPTLRSKLNFLRIRIFKDLRELRSLKSEQQAWCSPSRGA